MPALLLLLSLIFVTPPTAPKASQIVGQWVSKEKDLKIEVFERNGLYYGKMVWFSVESKTKTMDDFKDVNNPNKSLRTRQWKDMVVFKASNTTQRDIGLMAKFMTQTQDERTVH